MMKQLYIIFCVVGCLFFCACSPNRATGNFMDFPELTTSAIIEQASLSEEDRNARLDMLKALDAEPEEPYTINAGDELRISVYDHPELSVVTPVTPDGHIGMIFVGQEHVAGLSIPKAADRIAETLSAFIKNPIVGISPVSIRSQTATIAGAVTNPGMYPISSGMRLRDLFATAGGSASRYYDGQTLEAADFKNSIFVRGDRVLEVDFAAAIEDGDYWNNIRLHKNDYVYIAVRSEATVCLLGAVNTPRQYLWNKSMGLLEIVSAGGGLHETYWRYAIIIRGGIADPTFYRVDLDGVLQGRRPNVMLEPGDIVYIPHDNISEYNVFIRKLIPTAQLINLLATPAVIWTRF